MQTLLAQNRPAGRLYWQRYVAFGAYKALYRAGLRDDMAVIGYDDIELASYMTPPLTTIHQPKMNWVSWPLMIHPNGAAHAAANGSLLLF